MQDELGLVVRWPIVNKFIFLLVLGFLADGLQVKLLPDSLKEAWEYSLLTFLN